MELLLLELFADRVDLLAGIDAEYPSLKIKKVSIDDDNGYKQLAEAEAKYNIKNPGERLLFQYTTSSSSLQKKLGVA